MIIAVINVKEGRGVMTVDISNVFIQILLPNRYWKKGDWVIIKFTGQIVDFLVKMNLGRYEGFIVFENGKKVIYVGIIWAIYRMIIASFYGIWNFVKI